MANSAHVTERPAGLTALALLNFGLALLCAVSYASLLRLLADTGAPAGAADVRPSAGLVYAALATGLVCSILLVVSGIGYLRKQALWGRTIGNTYALLALANSAVVIAALPGGFGLATVVGLLYAPLTLALLNLRFRAEFA